WHLDDSKQIDWFQNRILQHIKDFHLEDIATTIGPAPQGTQQLSPNEIKKIMTAAAKEAAKPVGDTPTRKMTAEDCSKTARGCFKGCPQPNLSLGAYTPKSDFDAVRALSRCMDACSKASDTCFANLKTAQVPANSH